MCGAQVPGLCGSGDPIEGFTHDRQAAYQWSHTPRFPPKALFNVSELRNKIQGLQVCQTSCEDPLPHAADDALGETVSKPGASSSEDVHGQLV